jgi:hypothetical protein
MERLELRLIFGVILASGSAGNAWAREAGSTGQEADALASSGCNASNAASYDTPLGKISSIDCDPKSGTSSSGIALNGKLFWRGVHLADPAYSYTSHKGGMTEYQVYSTPDEPGKACPVYALFFDYTSDKPIVYKIGVRNACAEISGEPAWVPSIEQADAGMKPDFAGGLKVDSQNVTITLGGDSGSPKLVFVYDRAKHEFIKLPKLDPDNLPTVDHATHPDGSPLTDQELGELADGMKPFVEKVSL